MHRFVIVFILCLDIAQPLFSLSCCQVTTASRNFGHHRVKILSTHRNYKTIAAPPPAPPPTKITAAAYAAAATSTTITTTTNTTTTITTIITTTTIVKLYSPSNGRHERRNLTKLNY